MLIPISALHYLIKTSFFILHSLPWNSASLLAKPKPTSILLHHLSSPSLCLKQKGKSTHSSIPAFTNSSHIIIKNIT